MKLNYFKNSKNKTISCYYVAALYRIEIQVKLLLKGKNKLWKQ